MIKQAGVVIIGGGIIGCATAYYLARSGCRDVVVLEKGYLAGGATGRCGAGIRQQWGTRLNCLMARESLRHFEKLEEELAYPGSIELKQEGYLFLAYTGSEWEQLKQNVALQQSLEIPSKLVSPQEARDIVPHLDTAGLLGATFCHTDGHANPFYVTDAYAGAASRLGVKFLKYTEATGIVTGKSRLKAVKTSAGDISTSVVLNAAGACAGKVAALAGLKLPIRPERHEILATEPVSPLQGPMVISMSRHFYCQQTPHGNFIMGLGDPNEPESFNIRSSRRFLTGLARTISRTFPLLGELKVIRQWAGLYEMTPDAHPILGESEEITGFFTAAGFSGHGFMVAPATARATAELILGREPGLPIDLNMLKVTRFARGELIREPAVV